MESKGQVFDRQIRFIAALRKFKSDYPNLNESTIRSFKTKYQDDLKKAEREKREPNKTIEKYSSRTGRPLLLGELDSMVQTYLIAQSKKGCVINKSIADATTRALISRCPNITGNIDIVFYMGFARRRKTSTKVEILEASRKEMEYLFSSRNRQLQRKVRYPIIIFLTSIKPL